MDGAGVMQPADEIDIQIETLTMGEDIDDEGRLAFLGDTSVFGLVGQPETDRLPVALFEPGKTMLAGPPGGGVRTEVQVEGSVQAGLRRVGPGLVELETARGWTVTRLPGDRLLLADAGGPWSRIGVDLRLEQAWLDAVRELGVVVCLYGPALGVRRPPALSEREWTPAARGAELREARGRGLVAGGLVAWRE
jgi:hypothetical protein